METNSNNKPISVKERRKKHGIGFALFLIFAGGVFLCLNLGIIPIIYKSILISWQMLLIVLGISALLKRQFVGALFMIGIGGFFIYPTFCHIVFPNYPVNIDFKTYWPVLLIIAGIFLFLSKFVFHSKKMQQWENNTHSKCCHYRTSKEEREESVNLIDKNLVFGSSEQIILSQNFKGGDVNVMFGELIIDLRKAKLSTDAKVLELNIMFGSVVIYVPEDWNIELQKSNTLFGAFEDKRYQINKIAEENTFRLVIKGSSMFGSGEIRN